MKKPRRFRGSLAKAKTLLLLFLQKAEKQTHMHTNEACGKHLASLAGGGSHVTGFWPVEYPEWVEVMDTNSLFDP